MNGNVPWRRPPAPSNGSPRPSCCLRCRCTRGPAEGLHDEPNAADNFLAMLQHQTMVCGNVRFAFRPLIIMVSALPTAELILTWVGNPRRPYPVQPASRMMSMISWEVSASAFSRGVAVRAKGVLEVIFDHDRKRRHTDRYWTGFNRHNRARNTGVDGCAETRRSTDHLTNRHRVAFLHHGLVRCADVHRHRDHDLRRGIGQRLDRFLLSSFLVLGGWTPP